MPPVTNASFGNDADCAERRAQSLKWICLGLNLERLIFQLEWVLSQKPQVGSRRIITLISWWWVWKALLPAWLQQEHQHSELNCLSHSRMHQERLIPVQEYLIGDEFWNFYLLKNKPNQIKHLPQSPVCLLFCCSSRPNTMHAVVKNVTDITWRLLFSVLLGAFNFVFNTNETNCFHKITSQFLPFVFPWKNSPSLSGLSILFKE